MIAIPALNVFGLLTQSRNYVDKSDLEISFPGVENGSFAERQAYLLSEHVLSIATHCVDLHTGGVHFYRFPQVYTSFENVEALEMAQAFKAPILQDTKQSRGLLWMMQKKGIPALIYEAGESYRIDEREVRIGVKGLVNIMKQLRMTRSWRKTKVTLDSYPVKETQEVYAPGSGLCQFMKTCGMHVKKNELIATIADPFGTGSRDKILSPFDGVIIGQNQYHLLTEGEFVVEIAKIADRSFILEHLEHWESLAKEKS